MKKIAAIMILLMLLPLVQSYPSIDGTQDEAYGVAIDSKGDVIVVGQHYDGSKFVMRVQKYDGDDGKIKWQTDFDEYATNIGKAVVVDGNDNIYAGGIVGKEIAGIPIPSTDYVIVKYDADGNELIYKTYNNGFADFLMDMTIDDDGYIYATGMTLYIEASANLTNIDFWTIKVDPNNLNKIEEHVFDNSIDAAFGIDARGDAVVVAGTVQSDDKSKYCLIKYDKNLNVKWVKYYDDRASTASDAAILPNGNIVVTGNEYTNNQTMEDFLTILYDSNGNKQWAKKEISGEKDDALTVCADPDGNIVVAGYRTENLHKKWYIIKYNGNGNIKWELPENIEGEIKRIAIDSDGSIVAAGYKVQGGGEAFCIRKYSANGDFIWEASAESPQEPVYVDFTWIPSQPTRVDYVHFIDKSTGDIISWHWDFGDGTTSNEQNPVHQYTNLGTYTVTLTITTSSGEKSLSKEITVINSIPYADFTYQPLTPLEGQEITFDASASYDSDGSIVNYTWNFGDGSTAYGKVVTHIYDTNGTYKVTLTIKDNDGGMKSVYKYLTINPPGSNIPPVPKFTYHPTNPQPGEEITFNASESYDEDGFIQLYKWDFGDGTYEERTIPVAVHEYAEAGEYTVTLQVMDNNGSINTYSLNIKVGGGNPQLIITLGVSNIAPIKEGTERVVPIEVYCYNFTATNVTIVVVDDANLTITPYSPPITLKPGEQKKILIKIKAPKLGENLTAGTKTIKVKAVCNEGVESNIEEIEVVIHKAGKIPSFTFIAFLAAFVLALIYTTRNRKK